MPDKPDIGDPLRGLIDQINSNNERVLEDGTANRRIQAALAALSVTLNADSMPEGPCLTLRDTAAKVLTDYLANR